MSHNIEADQIKNGSTSEKIELTKNVQAAGDVSSATINNLPHNIEAVKSGFSLEETKLIKNL